MEIRIVFTKTNSFISRAIMWFAGDKDHPERNCSHVIVKFRPGGVLADVDEWAGFEAMERGVWLSPWKKCLGKGTVVAEFSLNCDPKAAHGAVVECLEKYLDWYYDYAGIGLWAYWILMKRWFGSFVRLFHMVFNPKKAHKALFCSGLALRAVQEVQERQEGLVTGWEGQEPRTSTPIGEINPCFEHKDVWTWLGGIAKPDEFGGK
jgi:hypothetical protein